MRTLTTTIAICACATLAGATDYVNIDTQRGPTARLPSKYDGGTSPVFNPEWKIHKAKGWRVLPARAKVPVGHAVLSRRFEQGAAADNADEKLTTRPQSEIEAKAKAAHDANFLAQPALVQQASAFRTLIRSLYPLVDKIEINHEYTYERIAGELMALGLSNPAKYAELAFKGLALITLYDALSPNCYDQHTWSIPWESIP